MNNQEFRKVLEDQALVESQAFELVQYLCCRYSSGENRLVTQELVLRLLEHREHLGTSASILESLVRDIGLFPYLQESELSYADQLALEAHRPASFGSVVFHHPQAKVFHTIMSGKSVVLSAPTSFGKSLIIDALIATGRFANIVIVVPTLALIDETRRRIAQHRLPYSVITQSAQKPSDRNIFVMTQERVLECPHISNVDFFVIDEFYKLSPINGESDERASLLNQAFYTLLKKCSHFYMLGPSIKDVSEAFKSSLDFVFFNEEFHTVVSELHPVDPGKKPIEKLQQLAKNLADSTLVFCSSPDRARSTAEVLPETPVSNTMEEAASWMAENYHPEWHLVASLRRGIGIHHGRIPRAMAQFVVRAFNDAELKFLVCTSTLIEGVNTKAKNIVIFDHKINKNAIDLFTFNNIRGRSGRMFQHYVGHVYLFNEPPQEGLPFVDIPALSQDAAASDTLLVQIDRDDLSDAAEARIVRYKQHPELPFEIIKMNVGISPDSQLALADELASDAKRYADILNWSGMPNFKNLEAICDLIWTFFGGSALGSGSARTARQLAMMLLGLSKRLSLREYILQQLPYSNGDADQAVRAVLDFQRLWATFHFPRLLRAIGRIQDSVFSKRNLPTGSYDQYATLVEHLFLGPSLVALEEYGIPLPLARKLESFIGTGMSLDHWLTSLRTLEINSLGLSNFEKTILIDAQQSL